MKSEYVLKALSTRKDWAVFEAGLAVGKGELIRSLLDTFRAAGGRLCVQEGTYIDRDFSSAYAAFYSTLYKPYLKYCRRLHFFAADADLDEIDQDDIDRGAEGIAALVRRSAQEYLGYIVVRPLSHAPVSHAVVSAKRFAGQEIEISVRSTFKVHLLGTELQVDGIPVTEQDKRTGSCAQAAIWSAGRHLHNRHAAPWFSMTDITEAALRPADSDVMQALPAGSEHLTADNMVRALTAMGERAKVHGRDPESKGWAEPAGSIVARYVDSGIPVIIGLSRPGELGHAVVAVGARYDWTAPFAGGSPGVASLADRMTHFVVNDDQRGIYWKLPLTAAGAGEGCIPYNIEEHAEFILIPLPNKVFVPGEVAERIAWDKVRSISESRLSRVQLSLGKRRAASWNVDPDFYDAVKDGLVARTYLTYGWKHKQRMLCNMVSTMLKRELLLLQLPRFVWVTEFSLPGDVTGSDKCACKVRSHVVVDATGSRFWDSVILTHIPGIVMVETFDVYAAGQPPQTILRVTEEDAPYYPKVRGWDDYEACAIRAD